MPDLFASPNTLERVPLPGANVSYQEIFELACRRTICFAP